MQDYTLMSFKNNKLMVLKEVVMGDRFSASGEL